LYFWGPGRLALGVGRDKDLLFGDTQLLFRDVEDEERRYFKCIMRDE
jgi:hypothetical protein